MIVSYLTHIHDQIRMSANLEKAFQFLSQNDLANLPDGRAIIDGENVYAEVQSYDTKPQSEAKYEAHRRYIDVQFVVSGEEYIGWSPIEKLNITTPYNTEHDYLLGNAPANEVTLVRLNVGQFAVLYPFDAHAPRLSVGQATHIKKIVVKVAVN
jgi:YhcH/YjgK/YiaL family protein